ncbi:Protein white, partial [Durusdinium trenchii]
NLLVSLIYGWLFFGAGLQEGQGQLGKFRHESRDLGFASQSLPEGRTGEFRMLTGEDGIKPCDDEVLRNHPAKALARDQCVRMFQAVHWGALSIVAINTMMGSITWAITVFQNERFLREASSGYYTNFSYFLSKTLFEFPVMAISVVVSILSVYWLMNLNANPLALMAEVLLLSVASSSIVFCLSAQASTPEQAYALAPIAQIPQFAFAGILIPNEMVPLSLRWLKWLCPLYYGMTMMSLSAPRPWFTAQGDRGSSFWSPKTGAYRIPGAGDER